MIDGMTIRTIAALCNAGPVRDEALLCLSVLLGP